MARAAAVNTGYSGTPLWKKLGLEPGGRVLLSGAPRGWSVGDLPEGATETAAKVTRAGRAGAAGTTRAAGAAGRAAGLAGNADAARSAGAAGSRGDVTIAFVGALAELAGAIEPLARRIFPDGALWVAWPRRAAGHESDIREQDIRDLALPLGIVDVKVAALDEDWSGLRLVWRKERRHA